MGQAGYGVDQMYLWYQRDGAPLQHDIHILAFIGEDFRRMRYNRAFGYGKPVLSVRNGELVVENVPVPRQSSLVLWFIQNRYSLRKFKTIELFSRILQKSAPQNKTPAPSDDRMLSPAQREVLDKMLDVLQAAMRPKNRILVLVYLPVGSDYKTDEPSRTIREFLREAAAKKGILYVDLVDDFQKLPRQEMERLFIPVGAQYYLAAPGHYSVEGHEYVARALYNSLLSLPEVSKKLSMLSQRRECRGARGITDATAIPSTTLRDNVERSSQ
jgi:hypothetical protein